MQIPIETVQYPQLHGHIICSFPKFHTTKQLLFSTFRFNWKVLSKQTFLPHLQNERLHYEPRYAHLSTDIAPIPILSTTNTVLKISSKGTRTRTHTQNHHLSILSHLGHLAVADKVSFYNFPTKSLPLSPPPLLNIEN